MNAAAAKRGARALALIVTLACAAADSRADMPIPEGASVVEVARSMRLNGHRVSIRQFALEWPVERVRDWYRVRFGSRRVEPPLDGHVVVAAMRGTAFVTVRLTRVDDAHTSGFIVETPRQSPDEDETEPQLVDWPSGSRVRSDCAFDDAGRRGRLLVVENETSAMANASHLRKRLHDRGYVEERDHTVLDPEGRPLRTLWFDGPEGSAIATVVEQGERRMVILDTIRRLGSP
jgi:hypothetical protein